MEKHIENINEQLINFSAVFNGKHYDELTLHERKVYDLLTALLLELEKLKREQRGEKIADTPQETLAASMLKTSQGLSSGKIQGVSPEVASEFSQALKALDAAHSLKEAGKTIALQEKLRKLGG